MIEKVDMMSVLLDACPSFAPQRQTYLDEWGDGEEIPLYPARSLFARRVIGMFERGEMESMPAIFAAVERLHVHGVHDVQEAATVGLLEDLPNRSLHTVTEPEVFRRHLGPESSRWWDKLDRFWYHGEQLTDD